MTRTTHGKSSLCCNTSFSFFSVQLSILRIPWGFAGFREKRSCAEFLAVKGQNYCRQKGIWPQEVAGYDPDSEPKWFERYCTLRNVSAKHPPTVLIHGTADTDVPYEESDAMDKALPRHDAPHKFISVPGAGHALHVPENDRMRVFQETRAFVKEHLQ